MSIEQRDPSTPTLARLQGRLRLARSVAALVAAAFLGAAACAQAQPAPPAPPAAAASGPMNDCSLYRYKSQLGEVAAATVDKAIARIATSKALRDAVQAASGRTEVTQAFQDEGLLQHDPDCGDTPQVRAWSDGSRIELDVGAQQPEVCIALVGNPRYAARGFRVTPLHVPSGEPVCGYSTNFIPKILALGRATEAGRMISGSNVITFSKAFGPARAASVCTIKGQIALTPAYQATLAQKPGPLACTSKSLSSGMRQCMSLYDPAVTCRGGNPRSECEAGVQQVIAALAEFQSRKGGLRSMSPAARVELLERLMAVTDLDKLAAVPELAQHASLYQQQIDALGAIFADGRLNMVPGYEAKQQARYAQISSGLAGGWVAKVAALRQPGETSLDVWARLTPSERWAATKLAYATINQGFALRPRPLDARADCVLGAQSTAGAYTSPYAGDGRADTIFICPNITATDNFFNGRSTDPADYFGDFTTLMETLLHETLHVYQMELLAQQAEKKTAADADSCTQARMLATGWSIGCPQGQDPAACYAFYITWPQEFQARYFSEAVTQKIIAAMQQKR